MSLDYWQPRKSEKAGGYFVVKDFKDKDGKPIRRHGDVFFAREEDVKKHCEMINDLIDIKHMRKMDEQRERRKQSWKDSRH